MEAKPASGASRNEGVKFASGASQPASATAVLDPAVSSIERATHYAAICRCHRDLWGPLCAPYLHGTVPIVLDPDTAKRIVTCRICRGDMEKRGMLDV